MALKSENNAAQIISLILHPLMMTTYGVALLFVYADFNYIFGDQVARVLLPVFLLSSLIPAMGIYFLRRAIHIESFEKCDFSTQTKLLLVVLISYFLLFYHFSQSPIFPWFLGLLIAPILLIIIYQIASIWTRLSMHLIAMGGLIAGVFSISYNVKQANPFVLFAILFLLAGLLATSRLLSGREKSLQIYTGFVLGFLITYLCIWCGANFVYLYLLFFE